MMSIIINEVNFDDVIEDARKAVKNIAIKDWSSIRDLITNIARGMVDDVEFIAKRNYPVNLTNMMQEHFWMITTLSSEYDFVLY